MNTINGLVLFAALISLSSLHAVEKIISVSQPAVLNDCITQSARLQNGDIFVVTREYVAHKKRFKQTGHIRTYNKIVECTPEETETFVQEMFAFEINNKKINNKKNNQLL